MSKEEKKSEKPKGPVGMGSAAKSLPEFETFMFKESPYYEDQLAARVDMVLAKATIDHKTASEDVRSEVKKVVYDYVVGGLLGTKLSTANVTKNMLVKGMVEQATGINDEYLSSVLEDDRRISRQVRSRINNDLGRTYQRWAGNMFSTALRGAVKTKDGRALLESRVNEWDSKFGLGVDKSSLVDNEKLLEAYFQGAQRNQEYVEMTTKGPVYVPPS